MQGGELIVESKVAVTSVFFPDVRMRQITEDADTVVDRYKNNAASGIGSTVDRTVIIGTGIKAASVDKDQYRERSVAGRGKDIEVQAILVIVEGLPLTEFIVIEKPFRDF